MSLCCKCNSKERWLNSMYCFECYMDATKKDSHIPKHTVNKEYEERRHGVVLANVPVQKKEVKFSVPVEIKKGLYKQYELLVYTGKLKNVSDPMKMKTQYIEIVVERKKPKTVKILLYVDEENRIAYINRGYEKYYKKLKKYFA